MHAHYHWYLIIQVGMLQHLPTESWDEIYILHVNPPSWMSCSGGTSTPLVSKHCSTIWIGITPNSRHHHTDSVPVINVKEFMMKLPYLHPIWVVTYPTIVKSPRRRSPSAERRRLSGRPGISLRLSPGLSEFSTPDLAAPPLSAASLTLMVKSLQEHPSVTPITFLRRSDRDPLPQRSLAYSSTL
jgi:hypothetical protein